MYRVPVKFFFWGGGSLVVNGLLCLLVVPPGPGIDSPHLPAHVVLVDVVGQFFHPDLGVALRLKIENKKIFLRNGSTVRVPARKNR